MRAGDIARVVFVLAAGVAAVGSASSSSNQSAGYNIPPSGQEGGPPEPTAMEPSMSLGLWRSTFGAVKIEADNSKGGIALGAVHGVWVYARQGQEVTGYFQGTLRGNVLQFRWQEPSNPPLNGEGYLVFDAQGRQYSGRWWSDGRDRVGDWNGWRQQPTQINDPYTAQQPVGEAPYGGQPYGGADEEPPPAPYGNQPPRPYY